MKTNAAKTEKEFRKLAFDLTKAKYGETISISVVLFSVLVISLLPGLYSISFLLFSVPLLFLPAVFAAEMKMRGAVKRDRPDYRETISMFGGYFFAPWRGVFRAMRTILITALIWAVASSISGVLYLGMASSFDKPFIAAYEAFQAAAEGASDYGQLNEMMYEFVTSPEAANFEKAVLGFSSGIAGYYFLHSLGVSSFVAQLHFLFDGKAQFLDNRIFFNTYRSLRPSIGKTYWKFLFFMPILYVVGFVASYLIGASFIENPNILPIIGFAGAGFLMLFALPYYWNLLMVLGLMFEIPASELIVSQGKSTIEIMAHTPGLPPSVLEETKKTVGVLEEILLKKKEEANKKENIESK